MFSEEAMEPEIIEKSFRSKANTKVGKMDFTGGELFQIFKLVIRIRKKLPECCEAHELVEALYQKIIEFKGRDSKIALKILCYYLILQVSIELEEMKKCLIHSKKQSKTKFQL